MAKKLNARGEKEMTKHMATVKGARKELKREAAGLDKKIGKKMTFALSQDERILKDMKATDRKKR